MVLSHSPPWLPWQRAAEEEQGHHTPLRCRNVVTHMYTHTHAQECSAVCEVLNRGLATLHICCSLSPHLMQELCHKEIDNENGRRSQSVIEEQVQDKGRSQDKLKGNKTHIIMDNTVQ